MPEPALETLRDRLFVQNPYEDFPLADWPEDRQGWGSTHRIFAKLISALQPSLIVEVGVWKGASALHLADTTKKAGLETTILCVDTWLGSPGIYLRRDHTYKSLNFKYGYPQLYHQFIANVLHAGHEDVLVPLPQTSDNAAEIIGALDLRPSVIHIDAAHEYGPVKNDLTNYFPLLSEDGVLIGDDFNRSRWPGVVRAAEEFAAEHELNLTNDGRKYVLTRRDLGELGLAEAS